MVAALDAKDNYWDRLQKLIPAEVTAAYLAIHSMLPDFDHPEAVYILTPIMMIACYLYAKKLQDIEDSQQLFFITFIATPVWIIGISSYRIELLSGPNTHFIPGIVVVLTVLFSPFFIKKIQ